MKIMVLHPGTQHSTKVVAALKNQGHDVVLVTTVYNKNGSLVNLISKLLPVKEQRRLAARKNSDLNDSDVLLLNELSGLFLLFVARLDKKKKIYSKFKRIVAMSVGKKAARIAIKKKFDLLYTFDSYAYYPFDLLIKKKSNIVRVLDCSAAYAPFAKDVYKKQIERYPELESTLKSDRCVLWNDKYYKDMEKEVFLTDRIICASNYTLQSLVKYGVELDKIHVVPYGYDIENKKINKVSKDDFVILYVGGVNVMKGIPLLIDAIKSIPYSNIRLKLVGNVQSMIKNMAVSDERIEFLGFLPHTTLYSEYSVADLFVFPSLSDGFGFSPLEAMNYGVPCIITKSSGISDIIDDGVDGFIVNNNSISEIRDKIVFAYDNRDILKQMSLRVVEKAKSYSIRRYEESLNSFIVDCE